MTPVVDKPRHSSILTILMALMLVRGLLYASITPPWQSPDEPQHYQMVRLFMQLGHVPSRQDVQMAVNIHDLMFESFQDTAFWERRFHLRPPDFQRISSAYDQLKEHGLSAALGHPPLYYFLSSVILWPFREHSVLTHLYILRVFSVLMSLGIIWSLYRIATLLSPLDQERVWGAGCFVVFLPMYSFLSGSLNNDALAGLLSALVFVFLTTISFRGLSLARVTGLIALLFLCLVTKRTTLFLFPLSLIILLRAAFSESRRITIVSGMKLFRTSSQKLYLIALLLILILIVVLILLYDGLAWHWWDVPYRVGEFFKAYIYTRVSLIDYAGFLLLSFASFWANFGWMNIPLDVGWYIALAILCLFVLAGGLRGILRVWDSRANHNSFWNVWSVFLLALLLVLIQSLVSMFLRHIPFQGRYLFPAIVPIALCFTWGFFEWFPPKYHSVALGFLVVWWVIFDWYSFFGYVLPYFYG